MKAKKNYQRFNKEFMESAVKLVEAGRSAAQVARELDIPTHRVQGWVRASKAKTNQSSGMESVIEENKRLKKENARLQEETEILKKAAKYFAQHQQ